MMGCKLEAPTVIGYCLNLYIYHQQYNAMVKLWNSWLSEWLLFCVSLVCSLKRKSSESPFLRITKHPLLLPLDCLAHRQKTEVCFFSTPLFENQQKLYIELLELWLHSGHGPGLTRLDSDDWENR